MSLESEVIGLAKMGRPKIDNPKNHDTKVRLDEKDFEALEKYCTDHNTTRAEVIRMAVQQFLQNN